MADDLINHIWNIANGDNKVNKEINNIDGNKEKDDDEYAHKYMNIVTDKISLINDVSELIDELMEGIDIDTSNNIVIKKSKDFKNHIIKLINNFNSYIKQDTKKKDTENSIKPDAKNNTKADTELDVKKKDTKNNTKPDNDLATSDDIKAHIIDKQKLIKQRYKNLLETKKTIKNNIELIYTALKKLPKESKSKITELIRLDTILNDLINVIWHAICERDKKGIKKIDLNKIKNVDGFIHQLKNITNNNIVLLKTTVIVKLNFIISDIKEKSKIDDVYNYNDIDKLFMIYNDLDKYIKHLKKDVDSVKQILKAISANQTDSHQTLMNFLN